MAGYLTTPTKTQPLPSKSAYNATGRAYPDVAARATAYSLIDAKGATVTVDGTSGSTPTCAGIVSLLNDARFHKGGKPLGFLNPWLYSHQDALVDIAGGAFGADERYSDFDEHHSVLVRIGGVGWFCRDELQRVPQRRLECGRCAIGHCCTHDYGRQHDDGYSGSAVTRAAVQLRGERCERCWGG